MNGVFLRWWIEPDHLRLAPAGCVAASASGMRPALSTTTVKLSDYVDPEHDLELGHALTMGRPHPPADISLEGLAVTKHGSNPSCPLVVETVGMERLHLSWQRGDLNAQRCP